MSSVRRRDKRGLLLLFGIFIIVAIVSFVANGVKENDAEAASLAGFDPGYIISDYQMGNYTAMSEADIQRFLTAKNSCGNRDYNYYLQLSANTNYTWHWKDGHFVCLSEELFGDGEVIGSGETAAHIIWQTAQDYHINPQVLLVLLQKETSLITDPIPNNGDYRKATGYGCPDTAPCSSQYYGFKNQVRKAAALFRTVLDGGWTNYPLGNNYVQYNPNAACGGSVVNIRSLATSALYRYTPYQPNAGAIAAGYGTAYCGAYGNRNFYLYFEDWFGGITDARVEWQNMQNPRIMTVNKSTLMVDADRGSLTGKWLEVDENYYFTKKLSIFVGGEQQVCLQRKIDEGTDYCALLSRLSDFSLNEKVIVLPAERQYEIEKWTCGVNILNQKAECNEKTYSIGDVINVEKTVKIDGEEFLIIDDNYAVLKARTRMKLNYETIGPVLMKLTRDSYKYIGGEDKTVQKLIASDGLFISIADKTIIDGEVFYRTLHDSNKNYNYVISGSALSDRIFTKFMYPRNLEFMKNADSINLDNGRICKSYKDKTIRKFINKINYNDKVYFQSEDEVNTHCAVKASELRETKYDFNSENVSEFVKFVFPRELRTNDYLYMIDVRNGKTCEDYLPKNNIQKYTTKINVDGIVFYRTENKTGVNSSCAVPASSLQETI